MIITTQLKIVLRILWKHKLFTAINILVLVVAFITISLRAVATAVASPADSLRDE